MANATELVNPIPPPLAPATTALAAELIRGLDARALDWLSGYMAGAAAQLAAGAASRAPGIAAEPPASARLTVLYGSQTGNGKVVAESLAARAESAGLSVRLVRADSYVLHELKHERLLAVVISTHSSGDTVQPPDDSRAFVEFLAGRRAPRLDALKFAVLALGDTSYPDFCAVGRALDARLAELGATRLLPRADADVDIESIATPWAEDTLRLVREAQARDAATQPLHVGAVVTPLHPPRPVWSRARPFLAEVVGNQRIVADGHDKEVRHIELALDGSGIDYQPGDALGVWPRQHPALVAEVIEILGLDADEEVSYQDETLPLARWLGERRELTLVTRPFVAEHARRGGVAELERLLAPDHRAELAGFVDSLQLPDLLRRHPVEWSATELVAALRPLAPRSYSIASSPRVVGEEVHLTVAAVRFSSGDVERHGVASRFLCGAAEGDKLAVFLEPNDRFRLPTDPARDVIMIGAGTGAAPFRAFLQERTAQVASGRNWLIFGNRHRRSDFLYQLEWRQALKSGQLQRLDVAFSRDQADKVYVQDRLRERGQSVWDWLDGGAHVYVCGDAKRMAPDVHEALVDIVVSHGRKSRAAAQSWLDDLLASGRYARDVY